MTLQALAGEAHTLADAEVRRRVQHAEALFALFVDQRDLPVLHREDLRLGGECTMCCLRSSTRRLTFDAIATQAFPAVRLSIESVAPRGSRFEWSDADAPIVASVCGRLDGIDTLLNSRKLRRQSRVQAPSTTTGCSSTR